MWAKTALGQIEYLAQGTPGGSSVILLHHGFGSAGSLAGLAERLSGVMPSCRWICYSRPGCGASAPVHSRRPANYLEEEAEEVLPALMDALNIARAHLIGHSDGGTIALLAAAAHPQRIISVSAIAPHVILEDITEQGVRAVAARDNERVFRQKLARQHLYPAYAYDSWRDHWLRPEMRQWNIVSQMQKIACPVSLIQGDRDVFGTFEQLELIASNCRGPATIHRLTGHGHEPHKSVPDTIARLCADQVLAMDASLMESTESC